LVYTVERAFHVKIPDSLWPRRRDWSAKILKIYVDVGSDVSKGTPLIDIELEKAVITIESEYEGRVLEILVNEGDVVGPGDTVMVIG